MEGPKKKHTEGTSRTINEKTHRRTVQWGTHGDIYKEEYTEEHRNTRRNTQKHTVYSLVTSTTSATILLLYKGGLCLLEWSFIYTAYLHWPSAKLLQRPSLYFIFNQGQVERYCTAHASSDITSYRCLYVRDKHLLCYQSPGPVRMVRVFSDGQIRGQNC